MKRGGPGEVTEAVVRTVVAPLPWHQRHRWFRVLWRTARVMMGMDTSMHCAGVAYFGFLSLFPAAAAAVLLLGLLARPGLMADIVGTTEGILPEVARQTIANQLVVLLAQPRATLGIGLFIRSSWGYGAVRAALPH